MAAPDRRVRRVRLGAPAPGLVRRGAVLVEDALRTASLGGDGGRLLLVRRVDVGRIRPRGAPSSVALALEARVRNASAWAVHAGDAAAASSSAVWFHDAVEAHAALALRLAAGQAAAEWFWPLAVPRWRAGMGRDEALRAVLGSVAELAPGPVAAVSVVAALVEEGAAGPLLDALRWQDGPALLRACGWSVPSTPVRLLRAGVFVVRGGDGAGDDERSALDHVEARWAAEIAVRARRWGEDDARTLWLAAAALVTAAPSRALDPGLGERAARLVAAVLDAEAIRAERTASSPSSSPQPRSSGDDSASAASAHDPGRAATPEDVSRAADRSTGRGSTADQADATAFEPRDPSPVSPRGSGDRPRAQADAASAIESMRHPDGRALASGRRRSNGRGAGDGDADAAAPPAQQGTTAAGDASHRADGRTEAGAPAESTDGDAALQFDGRRGEPVASEHPQDVRDDVGRAAASTSAFIDGDRPLAVSARDASPAAAATSTQQSSDRSDGAASPLAGTGAAERETPADARPSRPRFPDVPLATAGGGLVFLVPALNRLGMAAMLRDTPWAADAAFPPRLLRHLALRAGIPANDPVLAALGADGHLPRIADEAWCAPAAWARGIAAEGPTILRHLADGGRVLFDASARLPLAAWRGDAVPAAAEAWLAGAVSSPENEAPTHSRTLALSHVLLESPESEALSHSRTLALSHLLLESWTVALRRWCRRGARMGLSTLVHRPARVLYTRTHVDLLLDHHDADVRVRRAGLDVDPGWVPWLGRVVQIHYLYGERPRAK